MLSLEHKNILVTGYTGHLGLALIKKLMEMEVNLFLVSRQDKNLILGLFKKNNLMIKHNLHFLQIDLTQESEFKTYFQFLQNIDFTIHLAAHVPKNNTEDFLELSMKTNCLGSFNLIKHLPLSSKFIFISTCEIYGKPLYLPIDENHPFNPLSNYGKSKVAAEKVLSEYAQKNNFHLTILRFTSIYGPGESINRFIPNTIKTAIKKQPLFIYGDGTDLRDFLYLTDAVEFIIAALEKGKKTIYNIATGNLFSIQEVAIKIKQLTNNHQKIVFRDRVKPKYDYIFNLQRTQADLKYFPQTSIQEGLLQEINWFKRDNFKTFYLDLDGTILDVSDRLYQLYSNLLKEFGVQKILCKEDYWRMKRSKCSEKEIIGDLLTATDYQLYEMKRNQLIESEEYLEYDRLFPWSLEALRFLSERNKLILITNRKSKRNFLNQLKYLEIEKLFEDVLVTEGKTTKKQLIERNQHFQDNQTFLVGDTEEDIITAKELNVPISAVLSGIRDFNYLQKWFPDYIFKNLLEMVNSI